MKLDRRRLAAMAVAAALPMAWSVLLPLLHGGDPDPGTVVAGALGGALVGFLAWPGFEPIWTARDTTRDRDRERAAKAGVGAMAGVLLPVALAWSMGWPTGGAVVVVLCAVLAIAVVGRARFRSGGLGEG